jgi:hypothetical protein
MRVGLLAALLQVGWAAAVWGGERLTTGFEPFGNAWRWDFYSKGRLCCGPIAARRGCRAILMSHFRRSDTSR